MQQMKTRTIGGVILAMASVSAPSLAGDGAVRIAHQAQLSANEVAWSTLFPEGPQLAQSMLFAEEATDDRTPWSHDLSIRDASGAVVAEGGFLMTGASATLPLLAMSEEFPSPWATGSYAYVSGLLHGDGGLVRPVIGLWLSIEISDLALVAPVVVEALVPVSFPRTNFDADLAVLEASAGFGGAWLALDAGKGGPSPEGLCETDAFLAGDLLLNEAWTESGIWSGTCLSQCVLAATGLDGAEARAQSCLAQCAGWFFAGEGPGGWAWATLSAGLEQCRRDESAPGPGFGIGPEPEPFGGR